MNWLPANITYEEFINNGWNIPGTLVEIDCFGKKKQFLIGDMNSYGSFSERDALLKNNVIVYRYKILWTPIHWKMTH